jgi:REP element-mobilizing transposase RayT
MAFNPDIHHRRSIRLKGYDYSREGAYFVTVCTKDRDHLFGKIVEAEMIENQAGEMVRKWFYKLEEKFIEYKCDEFIIMPNHIHAIIIKECVGADPCVCPDHQKDISGKGGHMGPPLHQIIQWFKTMTTNEYLREIDNSNWPPFNGKLWQRNYYEHIIRNDQ